MFLLNSCVVYNQRNYVGDVGLEGLNWIAGSNPLRVRMFVLGVSTLCCPVQVPGPATGWSLDTEDVQYVEKCTIKQKNRGQGSHTDYISSDKRMNERTVNSKLVTVDGLSLCPVH